MHSLIPNDAVFLAGFHRLEELLHELTSLYPGVLSPEEIWTAEAAYEGWWRIAQQLPPAWATCPCRTRRPDHDGGNTPVAPGPCHGAVKGRCLHVIELNPVDLATMELLHGLLARSEREGSTQLADALEDIEKPGERLVDACRRILTALRLQPPPELMAALRAATASHPTAHIHLNSAQHRAYRAFLYRFEQTFYRDRPEPGTARHP
ncbi:hypothetical protein ACWD5R_35400 [Streptomyces sp. NPDC002514]|uniref:hypothetical protein n=1 Tax=unclassified Streptomyces TaxID=2593676 RepID=UPI0036BF7C13